MIGSKQKAPSKKTIEASTDNATVALTGALLTIPENTYLEKPIFIDCMADTLHQTKTELKNHIILKAGSKATIVEMLNTTENTSPHAIQNVSHYHLEEGAHLTHIYCQKACPAASASASDAEKRVLSGEVNIEQAANSTYTGTVITLGGTLNRATFHINANGSYTETKFYGLQIPKTNEQMDLQLVMHHHKSQASKSDLIVRGVVEAKGKGAFTGKIIIDQNTRRTKTALENKNLLLSRHAEMNTRPQLEVYSDDIEHCSHGATVGHLDEDALFYFKTRGIPEQEAMQLLIAAFISPSLEGVPSELKEFVEGLLHHSEPKSGQKSKFAREPKSEHNRE